MATTSAPARPAPDQESEPSLASLLWLRRGVFTTVLAIVTWWFVGFDGTADWLQLPLTFAEADTVFLGAFAAATAVGILVPGPWPRFVVVAAFSVVGWLLTSPGVDATTPHARLTLAVALAVGGLLGMALGSRAQRGTGQLATALAVLSPLCLIGWWQGPLLAVALALPFVHATRERVAPTVVGVVRVVLVWLVTVLGAAAVRTGWASVPPAEGVTGVTVREAVTDHAWPLLTSGWLDLVTDAVQLRSFWLWVGAALAVVVVTVRASRSMKASRSRD